MLRFRLVLLFSIILFTVTAEAKNSKPNILLITADDLGFDDLSIHNNPVVETPNIDQLANESVTFSDFSVSPVCSTTRASLLTGRHFYKTGVSGVHGGRDYLNKSETLISQMLKKSGYETGFWGKWHTGKSNGYFPWDRGFDEGYYAELYQHENSFGFLNGKPINHKKWVSEVVTDYAIDFITKSKDEKKPFFAYVSFLAPHEPWLAPDNFVQPYLADSHRPAIANLYGMISEMDFHIGRLLQFLETSNLSDNTIVIFMSDNGPWWDSSNFGSMTTSEWKDRNPSKLRGNKGQSWQNGIKSPLFIRNKSLFTPNKVERFINVTDILPTILELTGTQQSDSSVPLDGASFVPYLKGKTAGSNPRQFYIASHDVMSDKPLFNQWTPVDASVKKNIHFNSQIIGLRTEDYKLLLNPAMDRPEHPKPHNSFALFDIQNDPSETINIIQQKPLIAKKMKYQLQQAFLSIKNEPNSFLPPEYIIDTDTRISVINAFAPATTFGNTLSKAHVLSGLKEKGDGAEYKVNVKNSGVYKVYLEQTNTDSVGIEMLLANKHNSLSSEFDGNPLQYFGNLHFDKGSATLSINVIANNSIKPWAEVSGFRRIYLIPVESNETPLAHKSPN